MLEEVQRRAVGMVSNLRGRTYEARLSELGMTTLADRRVRRDMIATAHLQDNVWQGQG